jgi:hypothetical protein
MAGLIIRDGLVNQSPQLAALRILLDLAVPKLRLIAIKPLSQFLQFGSVQFGDSLFELLYTTHGSMLTPRARAADGFDNRARGFSELRPIAAPRFENGAGGPFALWFLVETSRSGTTGSPVPAPVLNVANQFERFASALFRDGLPLPLRVDDIENVCCVSLHVGARRRTRCSTRLARLRR